jgi:uncharacterized protein YggE
MRPEDRPTEDRLLVHGSARRKVAPDRALWTFVVTERDAVPAAAFERCGSRLDELMRSLRGALEAAEIRTGAVRVAPVIDHRGHPQKEVDATGTVLVEVAIEDAGRAAGAAMSAGADHLRGPQTEARQADAVAEELLGEAVAAARRKADLVAAAAGRRLGRVLGVAEDPGVGLGHFRAVATSGGYEGPELATADAELTVSVSVLLQLEA